MVWAGYAPSERQGFRWGSNSKRKEIAYEKHAHFCEQPQSKAHVYLGWCIPDGLQRVCALVKSWVRVMGVQLLRATTLMLAGFKNALLKYVFHEGISSACLSQSGGRKLVVQGHWGEKLIRPFQISVLHYQVILVLKRKDQQFLSPTLASPILPVFVPAWGDLTVVEKV